MRIRWRASIGIILLKHLFLSGNAKENNRSFFRLLQVLKPLRKAGLVRRGAALSYLSIFLSRSLTANQKLTICINHYSFLQKLFSAEQLNALFKDGIECYAEQTGGNHLRVVMAHAAGYEVEGPCSLLYYVNDTLYATLCFTMAPAGIFGLNDANVFYISCMQKKHTEGQGINKATHISGIHPVTMLLNALKAFGAANGIKNCVAISAVNQLAYVADRKDYDYFFSLYDDFWLSKGGSKLNSDYLVPFPLVQKSILEVKQTHRNRARKKRIKQEEIYNEIYSYFK
jgi:uncharacterized protein VirK/YbjX